MLESIGRIILVPVLVLIWGLMGFGVVKYAHSNDDGGKGGSKGGASASASTATSSSTSSAAGNVSQDNKAYGVGGTGLTSTAGCLGSTSILFGLVATTYVESGCITRLYAAQCKDDKCRARMTCLDPDLGRDAKMALGCPKE